MANKYTKMQDTERRKAAAEIIARREKAEAEMAAHAKERGEAEKKVRAAKKIISECTTELAELATA